MAEFRGVFTQISRTIPSDNYEKFEDAFDAYVEGARLLGAVDPTIPGVALPPVAGGAPPRMTEDEAIHSLPVFLDAKLRRVWRGVDRIGIQSLPQAKRALADAAGLRPSDVEVSRRLKEAAQLPHENARDFYDRLQRLMEQMGAADGDGYDSNLKFAFINGLRSDLGAAAQRGGTNVVSAEILRRAIEEERITNSRPAAVNAITDVLADQNRRIEERLNEVVCQIRDMLPSCENCGRNNHTAEQCRAPQQRSFRPPPAYQQNWNQPRPRSWYRQGDQPGSQGDRFSSGRRFDNRRPDRFDNRTPGRFNDQQPDDGENVSKSCWFCLKPGHLRRDCRKYQAELARNSRLPSSYQGKGGRPALRRQGRPN